MATLALGNISLLIPISIINDYVKDRHYLLMGYLLLLGTVSAGLYTIGLAHLEAHFKGQELAHANSAFIFCYGIGILLGPTLIGQSMDTFKFFDFSAAMTCFFLAYM
ncbi:hypothetical protein [Bartonella acomydis]|uniref:Major facilitator superfamily (MFS) profile domain-containing protein n=1 Tax=Bartonella acomydis TaxID=686234 RepID=A0ABP9MF13_9HYPH